MNNKAIELAYQYALKAYKHNEVPVGAVLLYKDKIVAAAFNNKEHKKDISGHAEINCLRKASKKFKTHQLNDLEMYVTLEPCIMCASAIQQSKIKKVYYGTKDSKNGGIESLIHVLDIQGLNHNVQYECYNDIRCSNLLKDFFQNKR